MAIQLATPTGLVASSNVSYWGSSPIPSVSLTWEAVPNAAKYTVRYKLSSESTWEEGTALGTSWSVSSWEGHIQEGKVVNLQVMAVSDDTGSYTNSNYSSTVSVKVKTGLSTPSSVNVTPGATSCYISWKGSYNASSYTVYYKSSSETNWLSSTGIAGTSTVINSLAEGTTYQFYVVAVGEGDYANSYKSTTVSATTKITLQIPTDLSATDITATSAQLVWGEIENASGYKVEYKKSSDSTWTSVSATNASYALTSLASNTSYDYRVTAIGDATNYSDSEVSSTQTFVTLVQQLPTPTGLTVTNNTSAGTKAYATVAWTAVSNATEYKLEFKRSTATDWSSRTTTSTSYEFTTLARNKSYDFRITAIGDGTTYLDSDVSSTVTKTTKSQLPEPENLTCINKTTTSLTFSWTAVEGTATYFFAYKLSTDSSYTYLKPTTNSETITGLSPGATYDIRLSARRPVDSETYDGSTYTESIYVSTLIPLTAPSNLNASDVTSTSAKVSWNSVDNATGYKVEIRQRGMSEWAEQM